MDYLELADDITTSSQNSISRLTNWSLTQSQNLEINRLPVELCPAFPHLFPSPHIIPKLSNKPPLPTDHIF